MIDAVKRLGEMESREPRKRDPTDLSNAIARLLESHEDILRATLVSDVSDHVQLYINQNEIILAQYAKIDQTLGRLERLLDKLINILPLPPSA